MLVIYGKYFFAKKVLAFRNDYCLSCAAPRMTFQQRSFDVVHAFWIPFLPLGLWKRWLCSECGENPHQQVRTSAGIKWVGIILLALMAAAVWSTPPDGPDDVVITWVMRIALLVGIVFAVRATLKAPAPEKLKDELREVVPNRDTACPFCSAGLIIGPRGWSCPQCGVKRVSLPARRAGRSARRHDPGAPTQRR